MISVDLLFAFISIFDLFTRLRQQKGSAACAPFLLIPIDGREATASCQRTKGANRKEQLAAELARRGSESHHRHQQKSLICLPTNQAILNDVCLRQMMLAAPNDVRYANDVCLTAHWGKRRIIAERSGATSYLRSKCIISPQAMHHLTNNRFYDIITKKGVPL